MTRVTPTADGASPPRRRRATHPAWWVAAVAFLALLAAAGFRAAPGALMVPLNEEFGWSTSVMSLAVSVNLVLYGLTAPFAAALMDRFGVRQVVATALILVTLGAGGSVSMTASWQLLVFWGLLIGLGTGSMALVLAATIANRWFVHRRGLVMGMLTAGSATGQLIFLPPVALLAETTGWRAASLVVAAAALLAVPLVWCVMRDYPADRGSRTAPIPKPTFRRSLPLAALPGARFKGWRSPRRPARSGHLRSPSPSAERRPTGS